MVLTRDPPVACLGLAGFPAVVLMRRAQNKSNNHLTGGSARPLHTVDKRTVVPYWGFWGNLGSRPMNCAWGLLPVVPLNKQNTRVSNECCLLNRAIVLWKYAMKKGPPTVTCRKWHEWHVEDGLVPQIANHRNANHCQRHIICSGNTMIMCVMCDMGRKSFFCRTNFVSYPPPPPLGGSLLKKYPSQYQKKIPPLGPPGGA